MSGELTVGELPAAPIQCEAWKNDDLSRDDRSQERRAQRRVRVDPAIPSALSMP
jgi:hypothetical protein